MLQWGRAMNGAEMRQNAYKKNPTERLQWGRAMNGAEILRAVQDSCIFHNASMGPRHEWRGNEQSRTGKAKDESPASMGPRHEWRGNVKGGPVKGGSGLLQWGRAMNGAEMHPLLNTPDILISFNGAAP